MLNAYEDNNSCLPFGCLITQILRHLSVEPQEGEPFVRQKESFNKHTMKLSASQKKKKSNLGASSAGASSDDAPPPSSDEMASILDSINVGFAQLSSQLDDRMSSMEKKFDERMGKMEGLLSEIKTANAQDRTNYQQLQLDVDTLFPEDSSDDAAES
jgi:hypothetical protein